MYWWIHLQSSRPKFTTVHLSNKSQLKFNDKSFHHQPKTEYCAGPTRNSEYYWYPDLEMEALSLGWKPRGDKKKDVPWVRKDLSDETELVAQKPPSKPEKKKHVSNVVTPEKRKRRKRN